MYLGYSSAREQTPSKNQKNTSVFIDDMRGDGDVSSTRHMASSPQCGEQEGHHTFTGGLENEIEEPHGPVSVSHPREMMHSYDARGASQKHSGAREAFGNLPVHEVM